MSATEFKLVHRSDPVNKSLSVTITIDAEDDEVEWVGLSNEARIAVETYPKEI